MGSFDYIIYDGSFHRLDTSALELSSNNSPFLNCSNGFLTASLPNISTSLNYYDLDLVNGRFLVNGSHSLSISDVNALNGSTCFVRPFHDFYPSANTLYLIGSSFVLVFLFIIYKWFIRFRG